MKHSDRKQIDFEIVQEIFHLGTPELQKSVFTKCIKKFGQKLIDQNPPNLQKTYQVKTGPN